MAITRDDVNYLAKLSNLAFNDEELGNQVSELNRIMTYVDELNRIDTQGVEASSHAIDVNNAFRTDEVIDGVERKKFLDIAPEIESDGFKIPRILT